MFDRDKWQEIFETISKNKWRTLATAFGVFWGIFMLVLLLGAGQGLQNGVVKEMILDATNSVWFFTDRTALPYKGLPPGRWVEFTEDDLTYLENNVDGVENIAAENWLAVLLTSSAVKNQRPFRCWELVKIISTSRSIRNILPDAS
jgi:putative ABC transport system permease protein